MASLTALKLAAPSRTSLNYPFLYRLCVRAVVLAAIAYSLFAGLRTVADFDMGWLLATGRYVVQNHRVPGHDVLSYTTPGAEWLYPPFAGVLFYAIYSFAGYSGLSWFCALACAAVALVLVLPRPGIFTAVLTILAIPAIAYRTGPRADLFTTLFFAVFMAVLWNFQRDGSEGKARLWLLPVVMLLWVNFHPGFIAGLGVIVAYLALEAGEIFFTAADCRAAAHRRLRQAGPWLAGTAAATMINPWGPRIYSAAITLSGLRRPGASELQSSRMVGESSRMPLSWLSLKQAINLHNPENGYWWLVVLAVGFCLLAVGYWLKNCVGLLWVAAKNRKQNAKNQEPTANSQEPIANSRRPTAGLVGAMLLGAAVYLSLQHMRYQALFAITMVIVAAQIVSLVFPSPATFHDDDTQATPNQTRPKRRTRPARLNSLSLLSRAANIGLLLVALGATGLTLVRISDLVTGRYYVVASSISWFGPGESWWFPERAAAFIRRVRLPGNVFEDYNLGGFAAWRLGPEYPDFVDGRGISPAIFEEQQELMEAPPDSATWQAAADRWHVNALLFSLARFGGLGGIDLQAFCRSGSWRPVYMDEVSIVFLRNRTENQRWLDSLQEDCFHHEFVARTGLTRPEQFNFDANAGAVLYFLGRFREAQSFLEHAEGIFPYDPGVHLTLAQLFQQEGRGANAADAEREYLAALERKPSDAAWYALGRLYAAEKRYDEAEQAIRNSAALAVHRYNNYKALGQIELHLQKPREALDDFATAENLSPFGSSAAGSEFNAQIAMGRAEAWVQLGNLAEAIEFQRAAVQFTPTNSHRWKKLAELYQATGQKQLAAEAYQRALELEKAQAGSSQ